MNVCLRNCVFIPTLLLSIVSGQAIADHHWDGSKASFGFNMTTGNSKSTASNGEFDVDYQFGDNVHSVWKSTSALAFQYGKSNGVDNKEQYSVQTQISRSFNHNAKVDNFMYVNGSFQSNKYTSFDQQSLLSVGYGRDWITGKKINFSTQFGPAYQDTLANVAGAEHKHQLAAKFSSVFKWKCFVHGNLEEDFSFVTAKLVNTSKSVTSYTDNIDKNLALNLSYTVNYVSNIPAGSKKTNKFDTTTSANLVYSFS